MIRCRLEILSYLSHLQQVFVGFSELQRKGLVSLEIVECIDRTRTSPLLRVVIEDKVRVIYDCHDGPAVDQRELDQCSFYFKRSCPMGGVDPRVQPLGLNYGVQSESCFAYGKNHMSGLRESAARVVRGSRLLSRLFGRTSIRDQCIENFEYYPAIYSPRLKVVFGARLWRPESTPDIPKPTIEALNRLRIDCVRACREKYGEDFFGGLSDSPLSRSLCPDLVLPHNKTSQGAYLAEVRSAAVCIATTGLHGSIGWKFAEYVAAARAIVSEPLNYRVTGDFHPGVNFLEFTEVAGLLSAIDRLRTDAVQRDLMMAANHRYYHSYMRPDMLVLHTLQRSLRAAVS